MPSLRGVGAPVVPGPTPTISMVGEWCTGALSIARYAQQYIGYECGFWGVSNATEPRNMIWSLFQRQELARALCEAQEEMEQVAGYFLEPKWITGEPHICSPTGNYMLEWDHAIAGGTAVVSLIEADSAVDHTADPAIVGPIVTAITDPNEVKIYYPDTAQEIIPSNIFIASGSMTIEIPRCRLVGIDNVDNSEAGLDYTDLAVFQDKVDVYRIYNDTSDVGDFIARTAGKCPTTDLSICMEIKDPEISHVLAYQSTTVSSSCRLVRVDQAKFNYVSGIPVLDRIADLAVTRLAHSKMPGEPCGYDRIKEMWRRDNTIPQILSVERLECPFGLSNGAWMAWKFADSIAVERMSVFG